MSHETIAYWKLNSPKMCRDFLRQLRIQDADGNVREITEFTLADGRTVSLDEVSDEEVIRFTREIADAMERARP